MSIDYEPPQQARYVVHGNAVSAPDWVKAVISEIAATRCGGGWGAKAAAVELIARHTGRSIQTVKQWQSGANRLDDETARKIFDLFSQDGVK